MGQSEDQCVFQLTSLQIGDFQSYLSELSLFLANGSNKLYIIVNHRPWLGINPGPALLWQLMVTKLRLSPFANTGAQMQRKNGEKDRSVVEPPESRKLEKWSALIDAASSSHKRVLFPVKKLRKYLQLSIEAHRNLFGLIIFEVEWDNVRGINYLNELQTDTCLALEAKRVKRWEFDSVPQALGSMPLWFSGTPSKHRVLKDYLEASTGDIFYDAEEEFPLSKGLLEELCCNDPCILEHSPTSHGSRFCFFSSFDKHAVSRPQTPVKKIVTKASHSLGELDLGSDEKHCESEDSIGSSSAPDTKTSVDFFEYKDALIILRFNDHDLPSKLRQIIMSELRLLTLLESGLPSWVIFLQSYPLFCQLYRPWMCPLARALYVIISVVTVIVGFYDLYKNVPVLKAAASHLFGPLLDWIETWEMVTRIKYLGTMLFLHNCKKTLKWFLKMTSTARSFFLDLMQPLAVPILELLHSLLPLWSASFQVLCSCFSFIRMTVGSILEAFLLPFRFLQWLIWSIGMTIVYPTFWILCEIMYFPIRMVLALADSMAFIWTYAYGSIIEVWQILLSTVKIASGTNTAVSHTYEVSKWHVLWNDLFSKVFRAVRTILNGFVAFFTACNRHRLSIYNHVEVLMHKSAHQTWMLNSQEPIHHRSHLQPKSASARWKSHYHIN